MMNDNVCYRMLQILMEQAWDAKDGERLADLSRAMDALAAECLSRQDRDRQAV